MIRLRQTVIRRRDGSAITASLVGDPDRAPVLFCHGLADSGLAAMTLESAVVRLQEADAIATIRIDDGKANAFNEELLSALSGALNVAVAQDRAALIVGRNGFLSAGFDLSIMRGDAAARKTLVLAGLELAMQIFEAPIPVVVCCTGHAIAAGTLLLLPADHVLVGDAPVKIGLPALFTATLVGPSNSAAVAGPPSPEKLWVPFPATV